MIDIVQIIIGIYFGRLAYKRASAVQNRADKPAQAAKPRRQKGTQLSLILLTIHFKTDDLLRKCCFRS